MLTKQVFQAEFLLESLLHGRCCRNMCTFLKLRVTYDQFSTWAPRLLLSITHDNDWIGLIEEVCTDLSIYSYFHLIVTASKGIPVMAFG